MMGPAVLFTVAMIGFPFAFTIWISLHSWTMGSPTPALFIGLKNYLFLLQDTMFWQSLGITIEIAAGALVVELVFGIYVGILLNRDGRFMQWIKTFILFPSISPSVAIGMVWLVLFDPTLGFINFLLKSIGLPSLLWLDSPQTVVPTLILVDIWQWTPFMALIVLGGLKSLPSEPYEAAVIDGAGDFQVFRYLTLPMLRPILWVALMLRSVDILRIFDTIYVMTQGGPGTSSTSLNIYAYQQGFEYSHMGYASTLMLVLLLLVVAVNLGLTKLRGRGLS